MQAIDTFVAGVQAAFAQVNAGLDTAVAEIQKIAADEANLAAQIADLKNNATLSPDDQAKLDAVLSNAQSMATRSGSVADSLTQLDASVPDLPPPPAPAQ